MVKVIYLIRHGQTEGAHERRYKGRLDVPLSGHGVQQAEATASYLRAAGHLPHAIYSSPLVRARRTAEAVSAEFGLSVEPVEGLQERDFGAWEGMTFEEIAERYPEAFKAWAHDPMRFSPIEGESTVEVRDRVVPVVEGILARAEVQHIAIIAHGGVNRVLLCHYMGLPLENIFRIEQDFACLNIIEMHDRFPVVKLLNGGPVEKGGK